MLIACRHGINQVMTNWADGVVGITQCALQNGESYTYEFTLIGQVGTFFWHAHVSWLRGTLYGAFIVHPITPAPYPKPTATYPILFGNALSRIYWFLLAKILLGYGFSVCFDQCAAQLKAHIWFVVLLWALLTSQTISDSWVGSRIGWSG